MRVWLEDWRLKRAKDGNWRLQAAAEDLAVDLVFDPQKRPVLQGDEGLSQKSDAPGNASWYYSYTRMAAEGEVQLKGDTLPVTGSAWMDREWSTSALGPDPEGWDWFALQLDDGTDIMLYRLRKKDGSTEIDGRPARSSPRMAKSLTWATGISRWKPSTSGKAPAAAPTPPAGASMQHR